MSQPNREIECSLETFQETETPHGSKYTDGQKAQEGRWAQLMPVIPAYTRWRREDGESILGYMRSPAWAIEFLK